MTCALLSAVAPSNAPRMRGGPRRRDCINDFLKRPAPARSVRWLDGAIVVPRSPSLLAERLDA